MRVQSSCCMNEYGNGCYLHESIQTNGSTVKCMSDSLDIKPASIVSYKVHHSDDLLSFVGCHKIKSACHFISKAICFVHFGSPSTLFLFWR